MLAALRLAGASPEVIQAARSGNQSEESSAFEVWQENWQALEVFLDLSSCWTWLCANLATPVRIGIAATEIESTLRLYGLRGPARKETYLDIRMMEAAALEAFSQ